MEGSPSHNYSHSAWPSEEWGGGWKYFILKNTGGDKRICGRIIGSSGVQKCLIGSVEALAM